MSKPNAKPLFLIKPGTIKKEDIARVERHSGVCIVECEDPEGARFLTQLPTGDISAQGYAALKVLDWIASQTETSIYRSQITQYFTRLIIEQAKPVLAVKK